MHLPDWLAVVLRGCWLSPGEIGFKEGAPPKKQNKKPYSDCLVANRLLQLAAFVCKILQTTRRVVVQLKKVWHKSEMEKVHFQSKGFAPQIQSCLRSFTS